jgi:hypothetical protein
MKLGDVATGEIAIMIAAAKHKEAKDLAEIRKQCDAQEFPGGPCAWPDCFCIIIPSEVINGREK